jgi:stage II sporulation protein D
MSQNGARNAANAGIDHVGILNFYYPNTIVTPIASLDNIRVHVGDASRVEMSSDGVIVFERGGVAINSIPSGSITVSAHDGGIQVGNAWTTASTSDPLFVSFPQPMKISNNGHRYLWGKIQLTVKNGKVRVVEVLPLEQYVQGIAEMPAAWPLEALMAQAIAARTYAHEITLHRRNSTAWTREYDISGSTVDQNYIGYDAQDSAWDQKWLAAVKATAGVEIIDSNGPVRAYYSASNGGYTETAEYVFKNDVPHTVAGPDPYDEGGHDWTTWTRTYTQESMSRWLNAHADTSVGTLAAINVLGGAGASARLDKAVVELVGSAGTKRVTGKRLMLVMNSKIFAEGGGLSTHLPGTFTTIGNGVGAGAPQPSGAAAIAEVTPDPVAETGSENADFTPPPGWQPEIGTGVPPGQAVSSNQAAPEMNAVAPVDAADAAETNQAPTMRETSGYTPPESWQPEPGTGVPPRAGVAPSTAQASTPAAPAAGAATTNKAFTPPQGWQPEAGSGIPPGQGLAPGPAVVEAATDPAAADESTDQTAAISTAASTGTALASGFTPPEGWQPVAGTGVPPGGAVAPAIRNDTVGGTGGGDAFAGGVLLVTRTAGGAALSEAKFEVIAPATDLAAEARARLEDLQTKAAFGLFADIDVDGYVASVAPRPVHAVCTATAQGVTCLSVEALRGRN